MAVTDCNTTNGDVTGAFDEVKCDDADDRALVDSVEPPVDSFISSETDTSLVIVKVSGCIGDEFVEDSDVLVSEAVFKIPATGSIDDDIVTVSKVLESTSEFGRVCENSAVCLVDDIFGDFVAVVVDVIVSVVISDRVRDSEIAANSDAKRVFVVSVFVDHVDEGFTDIVVSIVISSVIFSIGYEIISIKSTVRW